MPDAPRFRQPLLVLAGVLYLGIAVWRAAQGRLPVAGEPDWRSYAAGVVIIGGIGAQIALDL